MLIWLSSIRLCLRCFSLVTRLQWHGELYWFIVILDVNRVGFSWTVKDTFRVSTFYVFYKVCRYSLWSKVVYRNQKDHLSYCIFWICLVFSWVFTIITPFWHCIFMVGVEDTIVYHDYCFKFHIVWWQQRQKLEWNVDLLLSDLALNDQHPAALYRTLWQPGITSRNIRYKSSVQQHERITTILVSILCKL